MSLFSNSSFYPVQNFIYAKPIGVVAEHLGLWPHLCEIGTAMKTVPTGRWEPEEPFNELVVNGICTGFFKDKSAVWIKSTVASPRDGVWLRHGGKALDEELSDQEEIQIGSDREKSDSPSLSAAGSHLKSSLTSALTRNFSQDGKIRYMNVLVRSTPTEITFAWEAQYSTFKTLKCCLQASFDPQRKVKGSFFDREEPHPTKVQAPVKIQGENLFFDIGSPFVESVAELIGHAIQGGKIRIRGPWRLPEFHLLRDPLAALNLAGQFEVSYIPGRKDPVGAATLIIGALSLNDFKL